MTLNTRTLSAHPHTAAHEAFGLLKSWWDAFWLRRAQRATVMMLRSLDDYNLRDIGINRSEIESVVYARSGDRRVQAHFDNSRRQF